MNHRLFIIAAATLTVYVAGGQLTAQQLKLLVDRHSGNTTLTGADGGTVDFAGYRIISLRGTLDEVSWTGIGDPDWDPLAIPGPNSIGEASGDPVSGAGLAVNNTTSFDLGDGYDPSGVVAQLPLGEDVEEDDLSLEYYDHIADLELDGVVEFVGEKIFNNVGITVDLSDGRAYIENESPNNLTITGYLIESDSSVLNTGVSFTGLGGSFQKAPDVPDGSSLGELDPVVGAGQLLTSSTAADTLGIDLGVVVGPDPVSLAVANGDLTVSIGVDGVNQTGFVKYINVPSLPGDFNGDLQVNAADYAVWLHNLGAPTDDALMGAGDGNPGVDIGDYQVWKGNIGLGVGAGAVVSGSGAPVPEPSTAIMIATVGLMLGAACRRNFGRTQIGSLL